MADSAPEAYSSSYHRALIYARLGEKESALDSLEKALAERQLAMPEMGIEAVFDPLHSDPRFVRLLRETGLSR
jgi:hypothetical protein